MTTIKVTPEGTTIETESELVAKKEFSFLIMKVENQNPQLEVMDNSTGAVFTFTKEEDNPAKINCNCNAPLFNMKFFCAQDGVVFYSKATNGWYALIISGKDSNNIGIEVRNTDNMIVDDVLTWTPVKFEFFPQPTA